MAFKILQSPWTLLWAGKWEAQFTSLYGTVYTKVLQEKIGKHFSDVIMICERDVRSVFLPEKQLKSICQYLSHEITSIKHVKGWSKKVICKTDLILKLIHKLKLKKGYNFQDYIQIIEATFSHIPPNFVIKKVVDYLDKDRLELFLPHFSKARVYTEPVYDGVDDVLKKIVKFISKKNNLSNDSMKYITHEEIVEYFRNETLPSKELLQKREQGFAIWCHKGHYNIFIGNQFEKIKKEVMKQHDRYIIKGQTAYPGNVKGVVRIVFNPKKYLMFNKGDILVTGMTRPEYLPLMKLSAAFITDAGGRLSHAAIVARELKKPCIVGTVTCTKDLKDGELIEVDANNGIVRKVKR